MVGLIDESWYVGGEEILFDCHDPIQNWCLDLQGLVGMEPSDLV